MEINQHFVLKEFFFEKIFNSLNKVSESFEDEFELNIEDISWENIICYNLGICFLKKNDYTNADIFFKKALNFKKNEIIKISFLNNENKNKFDLINSDIINNSDMVENKYIGIGYVDYDKEIETNEKNKMLEAFNLFKLSKEFYIEFENLAGEILFTGGTDDFHIRSGSSLNMFGLIVIWSDYSHSIVYYLELLIHETAHLRLFLENIIDPLIMNSADELYSAPFRHDARPMIGIFHGFFVLFRIITVMKEISDNCNFDNIKYKEEINNKILRAKKRYDLTLVEIEENALFTDRGLQIFNDCKDKINNLFGISSNEL